MAIMVVGTMITGCGPTTETIHSEITVEQKGNYAIFQTQDPQEYFKFLENFDESKYEIIDISTAMKINSYSPQYYMVTYKAIQ